MAGVPQRPIANRGAGRPSRPSLPARPRRIAPADAPASTPSSGADTDPLVLSALPASTLPPKVARPPKSNSRLQRLKPGVTLGEVARACDLKVDHVSRIFNLKRRPKVETANRIATFLGISTPQLYHALGVEMVA